MADPRKPLPKWLVNKWLVRMAQVLCILAIASTAANSAHYFWNGPELWNGPQLWNSAWNSPWSSLFPWSGPQDDAAPPRAGSAPAAASAASARTNRDSDVSIDQLRAMHLFGRAPSPAQQASTENLQETKLSLTLVGVFVGQGADSRALIARKGRAAETYAVGDRLPGNAKLVAVHADRVVITRGGVRELIRFAEISLFRPVAGAPRQGASAVKPSAATASDVRPVPGSIARGDRPRTAKEFVARHWEAIERDPAKLLRELGVGTAEGGGAGKGYSLGTLANRPELNHTGLESGDRLLSVNGHPVGDPEADRDRLADLVAQGSLRLEIQRGERRMFITVAL